MSEHALKIHPKPFQDLQSGGKTGEIRVCADRDFKVGDDVRLMVIDETGNPTGIEMQRKITHIQTGYGLPDGVCVLSYGQYTTVDLANADADGYQNGRASVVVELPELGREPEAPEDAIDDSYMDAHNAKIRMRDACKAAIIAAGGSVKD